MIFDVGNCEEIIGFSFKDKSLLRQCFTHSSFSHEHKSFGNNERLEFFGDSILGYCVAEYLYKKYPSANEGELTEMKQNLVSHKPLSEAIERLGLGEFVLYGEGEKHNFKNRSAVCENLFEAIVAGIYLDEDGGLDCARKFIADKLLNVTDIKTAAAPKKQGKAKPIKAEPVKDAKSLLQEYVQKYRLGKIVYEVKGRKGPDHSPTFVVALTVDGKEISRCDGASKKEAEKKAAEKGLKTLNKQQASESRGKRNPVAKSKPIKNEE